MPIGEQIRSVEPLACPRCDKPLEPAELRGVPLRPCKSCAGCLVAQVDLIRTLEEMSVDLMRTIDPDMRLRPIVDDGPSHRCPRCHQTMTNDDYCAAGLVHFDRCETCRVLWLDAGELGTMALMWARMNKRRDRLEAENRQQLQEADTLVGATLLGRAVSNVLFGAVSLRL